MHDALNREFLELQQALAGRYSLERELGRGGMGIVYLAREVRLDRPVALKLLPATFAAQRTLRDRFLREARTAARLSHPHIVPIHAVDEVGDFVFMVMAYVEGYTLEQRVRERGPLPATDAARVLREVAWALAYAHAQGVVHRDIKPANILLEAGSGRALVTDFGIAHVSDAPALTSGAEVMGTAEFMSPEQAAGEPVDGRSDLYALGVVGYYMLSGGVPFSGSTVAATLAKHITQAAAPLSTVAPEVPAALSRAIDRCLAKDPAARFDGGEQLAEALGSASSGAAEFRSRCTCSTIECSRPRARWPRWRWARCSPWALRPCLRRKARSSHRASSPLPGSWRRSCRHARSHGHINRAPPATFGSRTRRAAARAAHPARRAARDARVRARAGPEQVGQGDSSRGRRRASGQRRRTAVHDPRPVRPRLRDRGCPDHERCGRHVYGRRTLPRVEARGRRQVVGRSRTQVLEEPCGALAVQGGGTGLERVPAVGPRIVQPKSPSD